MSRSAHQLGFAAAAARTYWPEEVGCYTEDDLLIAPEAGLAVVAEGQGAIGGQGCPGAKLAVWSLLGELQARREEETNEAVLRRGLARADEAVARLTASWPTALVRPRTTLAALLLSGDAVLIAHLGTCRVSRIDATELVPLTEDQTLEREYRATGGAPRALAAPLLQSVTRALGTVGQQHEVQRIPVRIGQRFLISTGRLHRLLGKDELHALLSPAESAPAR